MEKVQLLRIMGEFDALLGLSQETVPYKSPLVDDAPRPRMWT